MAFKKVMQSGHQVVIGNSSVDKKKFQPGFSYTIGGIIYTVSKDVTQEINSPMRQVILSDGSIEIIPVESIQKDLMEHDCEILELDERFAPKVKKVAKKAKKAVKKAAKKKVAKKKAKKVKKVKKND